MNNGNEVILKINDTTSESIYVTSGPLSYKYRIQYVKFHFGSEGLDGGEHQIGGLTFPAEVNCSVILDVYHAPVSFPDVIVFRLKFKPLSTITFDFRVSFDAHFGRFNKRRQSRTNKRQPLLGGNTFHFVEICRYRHLQPTRLYWLYKDGLRPCLCACTVIYPNPTPTYTLYYDSECKTYGRLSSEEIQSK